MLDQQRVRLENRIQTCRNEIKLAEKRIKADAHDLKFWKDQLYQASNELNQMQLVLNLRCSPCGG